MGIAIIAVPSLHEHFVHIGEKMLKKLFLVFFAAEDVDGMGNCRPAYLFVPVDNESDGPRLSEKGGKVFCGRLRDRFYQACQLIYASFRQRRDPVLCSKRWFISVFEEFETVGNI